MDKMSPSRSAHTGKHSCTRVVPTVRTPASSPDHSSCAVLPHGRPMVYRSLQQQKKTESRTSFAYPSTAALPLPLSASIPSTPYGRPTDLSSFTPALILGLRFPSSPSPPKANHTLYRP